MKAYTPQTSKGRTVGGHDIHHKTADQPKSMCNKDAKAMKHAARQDAAKVIRAAREWVCPKCGQMEDDELAADLHECPDLG